MKTKLFFFGILSFFYVNSQVVRLVELPVPVVGTTSVLSTFFEESATTAAMVDTPANDDCSGAVELTVNSDYACGTVTSATLEGATDSEVEAEVGNADDDVWFSFTATNTTHKVTLSNIGASGWQGSDLAMEVMTGTCGTPELVDYSDPNTLIVSELTAGTVYYVRVFSYYDYVVDTTFDICLGTPPPAPANDECAAAVVLTVSATATCATPTSGTLQSATDSGIEAEVGESDDDVWYSFVASSTSHFVTLTDIQGNGSNLVFEILTGACDEQEIFNSSDANAAVVNDLTPGTTYYLRIFSYGEDNNSDATFKVCVATPDAAPANDECDAAIALTVNADLECDVVTAGTLLFATDSSIDTDTGTADDDVWFSFTAAASVHKISAINIVGNTQDLVIEVFAEGCNGALIMSSDPQSFYVTDLNPGTVYYVRVFSYNQEFSDVTFDLCIGTLPQSPANDECEGAVSLTVNPDYSCEAVTSGTLQGATDSGFESETGVSDDDVWFSFTATSASHKISLQDVNANVWAGYDLTMEVMEGACGSLSIVESGTTYNLTVADLAPGTVYYVRVYSTYESIVDTTFDICIGTTPTAPVNDDCAGAIALNVDAAYCNGVLNNGTNVGATDSGIDAPDCFNYGQNDVWFSFTVPANVASVDISTDFIGGSLVDTEIALYSGSCASLTEEACDQDGGTTTLSNQDSYNSLITDADVTVGEVYYVRVSGYSQNSEGTFCLEISTNSLLSTEEFTSSTLKAYPNPVKDLLHLSNTSTITDVAIFNLLGQQVLAKAVNGNEGYIDMSHLSAGAYLVQVTADNTVQKIKIIKQ